jgi:iron complex transport system ATP-binding protein
MASLSAKNVTVTIGSHPIVRDVTFALQPGSVTGLIGPNGAGKSTLLRALAGLEDSVEGGIEVLDEPLRGMPRARVAQSIAYLPQTREVHWPVSVERVAALGRLPHLGPAGDLTAEDRAAVDTALGRTDLLPFRARAADTLSGGEAARLMLARALAVDAPVLLADEPVTSLDPYHQLQGMELLQSVAREDRSVLVVLHDLTLAGRFCDRVLLMRDGAIMADGPASEVLTEANLASAYAIEGARGEHEAERFVLPWRRRPRVRDAAE